MFCGETRSSHPRRSATASQLLGNPTRVSQGQHVSPGEFGSQFWALPAGCCPRGSLEARFSREAKHRRLSEPGSRHEGWVLLGVPREFGAPSDGRDYPPTRSSHLLSWGFERLTSFSCPLSLGDARQMTTTSLRARPLPFLQSPWERLPSSSSSLRPIAPTPTFELENPSTSPKTALQRAASPLWARAVSARSFCWGRFDSPRRRNVRPRDCASSIPTPTLPEERKT